MSQTYVEPLNVVRLAPVIFSGSPSQVVNAWSFFKTGVALALLAIAYHELAVRHVPMAWIVLAPAVALVLLLVYRFLQLALTNIVIDEERITVREGILSRKTLSLELFRIQDVTAVVPWWQRPFGVGTVAIDSSDTTYPRLLLYGIRHPELLRERLNRAAIALRDRKGIREVNMGRV